MRKSVFPSALLICLAAGLSTARAEGERGWDSHREYVFQPNVLYTVTYVIDEKEARTLDGAYFKQVWFSPATGVENAFVDPAVAAPQKRYQQFTLAEFWKEYSDGRQESYLVPVGNIVEVRHLVRESSKKK